MVQKFRQQINEWTEERLRSAFGRLTPDKRVAVIVVMLVLFGSLALYMTVSSLCNFGREENRPLPIERIELLELQPEQPKERLNPQKEFEYETDE